MTLKDIILPAIAVANLYKQTLIEPQNTEKKLIQKNADVIFLGSNNRHILLLVNNIDAVFLPDHQLTFLSGILTACKLSMDDIAIVNLNKQAVSNHQNIPDMLRAEIIILSGIGLSILELPFKIPPFQVQAYKGKKYVCIPSLCTIQDDALLKRKLWDLLRILFSI